MMSETNAPAPPSATDTLRAWLFVIFSITFPFSNWVPMLTGTGRTIGEQSDASDTLLVPWGPAFSIWFVIFLGIWAFALIQVRPANRGAEVFRRSGWWLIAAMALSTCWSFAASYAPVETARWMTAVIFLPYAIVVVRGVRELHAHREELMPGEVALTWGSASLFAGWCSIAVFLNWTQVFTAGPLVLPFSEVMIAVIMLIGALAWVSFNLLRMPGNWVYAVPVVWGLSFLAYARLAVDDLSMVIGYGALGGIIAVIAVTAAAGWRRA